MMRLFNLCPWTTTVLLVTVMATTALSGCQATSQLPTDLAWKKKEQQNKALMVLGGFMDALSTAAAEEEGTSASSNDQGQSLSEVFAQGIQEAKEKAQTEITKGSLSLDMMDQMVDQAAQEFVTKLAKNPTIRNSEYQLVMVTGQFDVSNTIDQSVKNTLQGALTSLVHRLRKNEVMQNDFVFIDQSTQAAKNILKDTSGQPGQFDDPYGQEQDTANVVQYHPDSVYLLSGKMHKSNDFDNFRMEFKFFINVAHPRTMQTIESFEFISVWRYHPDLKWITKTRDDELARAHTSSR